MMALDSYSYEISQPTTMIGAIRALTYSIGL